MQADPTIEVQVLQYNMQEGFAQGCYKSIVLVQKDAMVFWWTSLESLAEESYETGPHIMPYFDSFSGPVDSFGYDTHIRLAVF